LPILSPTTTLSQEIQFNSGTLAINGAAVASLQNITITAGFTLKELGALGTIKLIVAPKRSQWRPSCKFTAISVNQALYGFMWGSSSPDSSGWDYSVIDGQLVLSSCVITAITNDNSAESMQFQFKNAVFGSVGIAYKMDDAAALDMEIKSQDLIAVTNYLDTGL